mmetsp:Transcript_14586/g.33938  ORF Transcript_14586/g.33938 Transcript_14586/m.33938 type:complete len:878 (-) Transcript_14586:291-2924(-)
MSTQVATSSTAMSDGPVGMGGSSKSDNRIFPSASTDRSDNQVVGSDPLRDSRHHPSQDDYQMRQISNDNDEGVEVVLEGSGKSSVIDSPPRPSQDQNVFRAPHPVRPRARHPPTARSGSYGGYGGHPPPPPHSHSGPPHGDYRQHPYQPVPYTNSASFDQQDGNGSSYPGAPPTSQYSPHVQYPPPGGRRAEDLNVISPNHKDHHSSHHSGQRHNPDHPGGPPHHPPLTPRNNSSSRYPPQTSSSSYHYPPASPVNRGAGSGASPPRVRGYGMRRPEGPYSAAQRNRDDANGSWGYPTPDRPRPPVVAESSFDSEHHYSSQVSHSSSHPATPNTPHYGGTTHHGGHYSDPSPPHYGSGGYHNGSFEHGSSFDSHHPPPYGHSPPPRHGQYDHDRPSSYYGHSPSSHPPPPHQAEVSPYSNGYSPNRSYGGYHDSYSPHAPHYGRTPPRSYDEHDRYNHHYPYHPHGQYHHYPMKKDEKSGILLPKAASEVDFDISDPPLEPSTPASKTPVCESPADVNSYDVLCGRGGGTNSQVGNRRFRKLVQEFQPIYLLARRKEKPLLARTIVLVIRKRGGRFLKKDEETGELYEVGDAKAEAKTSQALREGLDVRATKSAASSLMDKKKKKSKAKQDVSKATETKKEQPAGDEAPKASSAGNPSKTEPPSTANEVKTETTEPPQADKAFVSPAGADSGRKDDSDAMSMDRPSTPPKQRAESPPSLPKLGDTSGSSLSSSNASKATTQEDPTKAPPSPEQVQFRKRRRMRSADGGSSHEPAMTDGACGVTNPFQSDKLFPDFCPPRADLGRAGSPRLGADDVPHMAMCGMTPIQDAKFDDDIRYDEDANMGPSQPGCAGIALDMMTGAAAGSFCLGPRSWSKRG